MSSSSRVAHALLGDANLAHAPHMAAGAFGGGMAGGGCAPHAAKGGGGGGCAALTAGRVGGHLSTRPRKRLEMESSSSIRINPAVLKWVMDNEGWKVGELAKETKLSASQIRMWTSAESDISIRDLRKMSAKFKRSMSVLYMAEAPKVAIPPFYRRSGGGGQGTARPSRSVLSVIRKARYVQGNAAELLCEMGRSAKPDVCRATVRQSPVSAATRSVESLGMEPPPQAAGSGRARDMQRYRDVREMIESRNVFTMQESIPTEDKASGFALVDPAPAVILVNSRDVVRRRIFTLLHEYAHVVLGSDGVCASNHAPSDASKGNNSPSVERWCDKFASAALMPGDKFGDALEKARGADDCGDEPLRVAGRLADEFCVSRAAALVRIMELLDGGKDNDKDKYFCCYTQLMDGAAPGKKNGAAPGKKSTKYHNTGNGPSQAMLCMLRGGRMYARLVIDAEESGIITTSRALDYLGIKLDHFDEVGAKCGEG